MEKNKVEVPFMAMNLQDAFLNQLRLQKTPVTVFLVGGHQIKGVVQGFDNFIVLLDTAGKHNLVYKHAISTIVPVGSFGFYGYSGDKPSEGDINGTAD